MRTPKSCSLMLGVSAVIAVLALPGAAVAGAKYTRPVGVTASSLYGAFGSARNSVNAVEYLYCSSEARTDGFLYGSCVANTAAGAFKSCYTTNVNLINVINGLRDSDSVTIGFDSTGKCTNIYTVNSSFSEPKVK